MAHVLVVLISGKQGSGKSTTAKALQKSLGNLGIGVIFDRFAKPVYDAHDAALAVLRPQGILPDPEVVKDGLLLQVLGNDWGRKKDPFMWVRGLQKRIQQYKDRFAENQHMKLAIVCEDCRYINEFESFPDALRVRLEADESVRKPRTDQWREHTTHQSEIDLDEYARDGKFDLLFHTDAVPVDIVVEGVTNEVVRRYEALLNG